MKRHIAGLLLLVAAVPGLFAGGDLEKAVELRKTEQFLDAERLLKKYASPAQFDSLSPAEKIEFLRCTLELAHIRALKDDVPGALALLNWAEGRPDPYQRAISCLKYAEILLDLGETERASAYLKDADNIIAGQVKDADAGAAIGQEGGSKTDTGSGWRDLRDEADVLKAEIESETLKKKYGASYGNYVKLRRMQVLLKRSKTPRYRKEALALADELMETDPASQFAAAAGYLKGEFLASGLEESSPKKEIKEAKDYLVKFVKRDPDGLYRGEALMLLGKISLEIEWNAKEAEKYYSQALSWFRKARERKDAVSLYAPMSDDLKKQTLPTQKPTTLNEWKRIVYHDEDPLKLYNTANAPVWYVDDKEKECCLLLGMFKFNSENYDEALNFWENLMLVDSDIAKLQNENKPNLVKRFKVACETKKMIISEDLRRKMSGDLQLQMLYGEVLFGAEYFSEANVVLSKIKKKAKSKIDQVSVLIALGENDSMGNTAVTSRKEHLAQGLNTFGKVYELLKGSKTTEEHDALWRFILYLRQNTNTHADAVVYTREFIKKFPRSVKYPWALRILVLDHLKKKEFDQAMKRYAEIKSMKGTERVLESLNGSFKFMGISIENGKFVKQGSTK